MRMQIFSQFRHRPLPALAVLLFSVIISFALCGLQRSNDAEWTSYQEAFETTPVSFTVTDFRGNPIGVERWMAELFIGLGNMEPFLDTYVTQLRMEKTITVDGEYADYTLSGITSAVTAPLLDHACGGEVTWFDGYDESIFERKFEERDLLCVIPDTLYKTMEAGTREITLEFVDTSYGESRPDGSYHYNSEYRTLTIVGTYASVKQEYTLYCPYGVVRRLESELDLPAGFVSGVSGILQDNHQLEEFRATAANWFGEVNPEGEETPWGKYGYEYYLCALDIDDSLLQRLSHNYQISIFINKMSSMLVLAFCTAAGFFIGFLMVRARKREIGLMRTLGGSNFHISLGFVAEQLLCVGAGIALGGALMKFNAPKQLALFALVYFVGLSAALVVFLHKNLLSSMKEDE